MNTRRSFFRSLLLVPVALAGGMCAAQSKWKLTKNFPSLHGRFIRVIGWDMGEKGSYAEIVRKDYAEKLATQKRLEALVEHIESSLASAKREVDDYEWSLRQIDNAYDHPSQS